MRWDEAVDVAYPGSGAGGFAVSIVAVDAGQTAFVADSGPLTTGMDGRLGVNVPDAETNEYLDAVTENLAPFTRCGRDVDVPIGVVDDPLPIGSCRRGRTAVEPFVGARLADWAARCASGEQFEAAVIGSLDPGGRLHGSAITDWLSTLAQDRGIDVHVASPLLLLVFEDGRCRSSAYPAAVLFTSSRPSASAWSRAGWRWALSTGRWTEFSSAAPADRPTDTARRQPENRDMPENGVQRKQQPSRGRRPGVVSPGVDRLSKRDATRRFAVGAVCFSRRGRRRRCQTDWSHAVADLSSANGGAAPAGFEARNIAWVPEQIANDVDEIILVDGNSTDATLITARSNRPDVKGGAPERRRQRRCSINLPRTNANQLARGQVRRVNDWAWRISRHMTPAGAVIVPPRIASWLVERAGLTSDRRIRLRHTDPAAYEILMALHAAALDHHRSGTGTNLAPAQPGRQESETWLTNSEAASLLGATDRAIRNWCAGGRLPASRRGGRWLINRSQCPDPETDRLTRKENRRNALSDDAGQKAAVAGSQRCVDEQLDSIRSNHSYSDTGRKTEMAKAVLASRAQVGRPIFHQHNNFHLA